MENAEKILRAARELINQAHDNSGQRYCGQPYSTHLDRVDGLLVEWLELGEVALNSDLAVGVRLGGRCHDYFEDVIKDPDQFGPVCTRLVRGHGFLIEGLEMALRCTDEPGATREERKRKTYPKIRECLGARLIKLADRVCHLEFGKDCSNAPGFRNLRMYVMEDAEFQGEIINVFAGTLYRRLDRSVQVGEVAYWREMRKARLFLKQQGSLNIL